MKMCLLEKVFAPGAIYQVSCMLQELRSWQYEVIATRSEQYAAIAIRHGQLAVYSEQEVAVGGWRLTTLLPYPLGPHPAARCGLGRINVRLRPAPRSSVRRRCQAPTSVLQGPRGRPTPPPGHGKVLGIKKGQRTTVARAFKWNVYALQLTGRQ